MRQKIRATVENPPANGPAPEGDSNDSGNAHFPNEAGKMYAIATTERADGEK